MDFKFDLQMFAAVVDPLADYRLKWGVNSEGIWEVKPTLKKDISGTSYKVSATVSEQAAFSSMAIPTSGYKYYLQVSNVFSSEDDANTNTVSFQLWEVNTAGEMTDITQYLTSDSAITVTAPKDQPIVANLATYTPLFTFNNAAAGSVITNMDSGDKVNTGTLVANDKITINGKTYTTTGGKMTFISGAIQTGNIFMQATPATDEQTPLVPDTATLAYGTVETTDTDGVIVKVASGKVTSISGLTGSGAEVTYEESANNAVTTTTFSALDGEGKMIERTVEKVTVSGITATVTYLDLATGGGEIFKGNYKAAVSYDIGKLGEVGTNVKYYFVGAGNVLSDIDDTEGEDAEARGIVNNKFQANAGGYYLKVSSKTTAATTTVPKTTTITGIEMLKSNAAGALAAEKNSPFTGTFEYAAADGEVVKYSKPATADFNVQFTNVDIRSVFTGLEAGDSVDTKEGIFALTKGNYAIYDNGITPVSQVNVANGNVTAEIDEDGKVTSVTNFSAAKESVTVVTTGATGTATTQFVATAKGKATVTITDESGQRAVYTGVPVTDATNLISDLTKTALDALAADEESGVKVTESIVADFDWTLNKSKVGYFAVTGTQDKATATVAATTKSTVIKSTDAAKTYVRVTLLGGNGNSFMIEPVTMTGLDDAAVNFSGTLTIKAPNTPITYTFTDEEQEEIPNASIVFTNVAANSVIGDVLGAKGKVTTAKLSAGDTVDLAGTEYMAGTNSDTLVIDNAGLYSGTVESFDTTAANAIRIGNYTISNAFVDTNDDTVANHHFTITATSGKTFKLGELDDGDSFKVVDNNGTADGADDITTIYTKNGSYLYAEDTDDQLRMYTLSGKAVESGKLNVDTWKEAIDVAELTVQGKNIVNLSDADKALAADEDAELTFVRDKYVTTLPTDKSSFTAKAVDTATVDPLYTIALGTTENVKAYTGEDATEQTINVTKDWTVTAGANATTTFVGATSGEDTLVGGSGQDTFKLNKAVDTVKVTSVAGSDEVQNYAAGDKLDLNDTAGIAFELSKDTAKDVYVVAADTSVYGDNATNDYVLLKGVSGKAVSISTDDGSTYHDIYFGNGKLNKYGKTDADTFTYADDAYYYGNNSGANKLVVGTLSNHLSKNNMDGDVLTIDLNATSTGDENGTPIYTNIDIVDASKSANVVALTAKNDTDEDTTGSTLQGGTYYSTLTGGTGDDLLIGGTGKDTFVISKGTDLIQKYTSGQDVIQTAVADGLTTAKFSADKNNVLIIEDPTEDTSKSTVVEGAAGKAISIINVAANPAYDEDDPESNPTIETAYKVYVGETKTNNSFTYEQEAGVTNMYIGNDDEGYTDKLNVTTKITELTELEVPDDVQTAVNTAYPDANPGVTIMPKYQGGTIDLSSDTTMKSIDEVDASGVKATAAALAEFGSRYIKRYAGVNVKAVNDENAVEEGAAVGTTFTGSAYNDLFTGGSGKDYINYTANQGDDIISGFGVNDTIKLYGLTKTDIANLTAGNATNDGVAKALANGLSSGGSLTVSYGDTDVYKLQYNASDNTVTRVSAVVAP